jgi:hypothetical protein
MKQNANRMIMNGTIRINAITEETICKVIAKRRTERYRRLMDVASPSNETEISHGRVANTLNGAAGSRATYIGRPERVRLSGLSRINPCDIGGQAEGRMSGSE